MCKFYILIFFIVGANCNCNLPIVKKQINESHALAQSNHEFLITLSNSIDQKFASISENLQKLGDKLDSIYKFLDQKEAQNTTLQNNLTEDCTDVFELKEHVSKSYFLQNYNTTVNCDMETDGGGWLLIQQRRKLTNQVDFNRDWVSYKEGFGELDTEFWIGNEFLHRITNQKSYELRIDMDDFEKGPLYATYSNFRVGNEKSGYQLFVGGYEGNATNQLTYNNGYLFTTLDKDNDESAYSNCAELFSGGFWYRSCGLSFLNGEFPTVPDRSNLQLIRWDDLILIKVEMKIRRKKEQKIDV